MPGPSGIIDGVLICPVGRSAPVQPLIHLVAITASKCKRSWLALKSTINGMIQAPVDRRCHPPSLQARALSPSRSAAVRREGGCLRFIDLAQLARLRGRALVKHSASRDSPRHCG
jgi:hypothetical protein